MISVRIGIMNRKAPLKMSVSSSSLVTPFRTKTFMPIGGEMRAISTTNTMMTPNHTKSNSNAAKTGMRIGMVTTIMARESMSAPRMMNSRTVSAKIMASDRFVDSSASASMFRNLVSTNT